MNTPESKVTPDSQPTASPNRYRRAGLLGLGAAVALGAFGYGAYWLLDGRYYESTDDAYVNGDVVQITSEVPGTVLSLNVDDTQRVQAGQPLLELDPADAKIAVANAEADLARAVRQVRGLFAQSKELRAQIDQREQAERTADEDLKRRGGLIDGRRHLRGRALARARRGHHHPRQRRRGTPAIEPDRRADRRHHHRGSSAGARRRGGGAQCGARLASHGAHLPGHRRDRQAFGAGRPAGRGRRRRSSPWCRSRMYGSMPTSRKCS